MRVSELFGERCFYEVRSDSELAAGDLRDDFFDIYRDLRRGLAIADRSMEDALWEWRFSHEIHWGLHARDALEALARFASGSEAFERPPGPC